MVTADTFGRRLQLSEAREHRGTQRFLNLSLGFDITHRWVYDRWVTWGELIRKLKAAGYVEQRSGKGSHRQFVHPTTGRIVTVAVHTKKEIGSGLASRILKDAGLK